MVGIRMVGTRQKRQRGYGMDPVRKKRQKGYGGHSIRKKRQKGYGRRRQFGRGPRWQKFKAKLSRAWKWAKPKLAAAGKKALPGVRNLILNTPKQKRKEALKRIGKNFGKNLLRSVAK